MLAQLGRHAKPAAFLDSAFWGPLETLMRHVVETGFADPRILDTMSFHGGVEDALSTLDAAMTRTASA